MIIDFHTHLWKKQHGVNDGKPVFNIGGGRSNVGGEIRQMLPPYLINGENTAEILISNMDYAGVSGAVATQEYLDGNQDEYLLECKLRFPDRLKICALYEEKPLEDISRFDGVKICACKLSDKNLLHHSEVFESASKSNKFICIELSDGALQTDMLDELADEYPDLKIVIGHFGMVTRPNWLEQIKLARHKNVFIECGGITWLFNSEFYPYPSAIKAINQAADIVGFEHLMWGSDYPRTMTAITYKMSLDFIENTKEISRGDKKLLLGDNAKQFFDFKELSTPLHIKNMAED